MLSKNFTWDRGMFSGNTRYGKVVSYNSIEHWICYHTRAQLATQFQLEFLQVLSCKLGHKGVIFSDRAGRPTDHPTTWILDCLGSRNLTGVWFFHCCALSLPPLFPHSTKYVRCPPSQYIFFPTPFATPITKVCVLCPGECFPVWYLPLPSNI